MPKKTIQGADVASKRVLMRVDFNVPLDGSTITDDARIRAALPTIRAALEQNASVILMSHLGRPKGSGHEPAFSLKPVADKLTELLGKPVAFPSNDPVDQASADAVAAMQPGDVLLLENLRFHPGEKAGDPEFAAKLAAYADVYVNDAFGTCHRTDASMHAVPAAMRDKPRVVGLLVEKELKYLSETLASPQRPYVVVLGGAKVADKLPAIEHVLKHADDVLIGGAMAYTFCAALGKRVGDSRVEQDRIEDAKRIIDQAALLKAELHIPTDHVCSTIFAEHGGDHEVFEESIKDGFMGLDIGPKTQTKYALKIRKAKTVVWNGPMGVFEWAPFRVGTKQVAHAMVHAKEENNATTIVGGGDSASAVAAFGIADRFSHVSTGGGASLDMISGKPFKALDMIQDA